MELQTLVAILECSTRCLYTAGAMVAGGLALTADPAYWERHSFKFLPRHPDKCEKNLF